MTRFLLALFVGVLFWTPDAHAINVCQANAKPPSSIEGQQVPCSMDLAGNQRILGEVQQATLGNSTQTSSTNSVNTITLAAASGLKWTLRTIVVAVTGTTISCSLTIADGATTVLSVPVGGLTASAPFVLPFQFLTGTAGNAMAISVGACGSGNTSVLSVVADHP